MYVLAQTMTLINE